MKTVAPIYATWNSSRELIGTAGMRYLNHRVSLNSQGWHNQASLATLVLRLRSTIVERHPYTSLLFA